jgi:hypothetical protein
LTGMTHEHKARLSQYQARLNDKQTKGNMEC